MLFEKGEISTSQVEEIGRLRVLIEQENEKFQRYRMENRRRKHNYIPFIVELLKQLAKEEKIVQLVKEVVYTASRNGAQFTRLSILCGTHTHVSSRLFRPKKELKRKGRRKKRRVGRKRNKKNNRLLLGKNRVEEFCNIQ